MSIQPTSPLAKALADSTYTTNKQRFQSLRADTLAPQSNPSKYFNIVVSHRGETLTLSAWSVRLRVQLQTLVARYKKGLRGEELLSTNMWGSLERPAKVRAIRTARADATGKSPNYSHQPITHNGETHTLKEWADLLSLSYPMLQARYKAGKTGLSLFSSLKHIKPDAPDYANMPIEYLGVTHTLREWADLLGVDHAYKKLSLRYRRGKRGADLFAPPTGKPTPTIPKPAPAPLFVFTPPPTPTTPPEPLSPPPAPEPVPMPFIPEPTIINIRPRLDPITYNGITQPLKDWARDTGVAYATLRARYKAGVRGEKLFMLTREFTDEEKQRDENL